MVFSALSDHLHLDCEKWRNSSRTKYTYLLYAYTHPHRYIYIYIYIYILYIYVSITSHSVRNVLFWVFLTYVKSSSIKLWIWPRLIVLPISVFVILFITLCSFHFSASQTMQKLIPTIEADEALQGSLCSYGAKKSYKSLFEFVYFSFLFSFLKYVF